MSKLTKKGKAPQKGKKGAKFDETALESLTSKIDQSLNVKDLKRKQPPTNTSTKQDQKRQRNSVDGQADSKSGGNGKVKTNDDAAILAEIKALGGDEDDWDLIKDIDSSDDEYVKDNKKPLDKGLKNELAALSKQLGFAEFQPSEASEEEDDVPEADEDESVLDEEEDEESEEEETAPAKPAKKIPGDMRFEPRADWHIAELSKLPKPKGDQSTSYIGPIEALKSHAQSLLDEDATKYRKSVFAQSSHKFLAIIMTSGTLSDKVSALTLAIQESPVHNVRAFDGLMTLASKKSRAQAIGAIGALVDSLGPGSLLPADRRLRTFQTQPGLLGTLQKTSTRSWRPEQPLPGKITEAHLIAWVFEDWLKATYFKIIQLLEAWCSDEIEYSRSRALDFVYGLLKEKPEQEANLLKLLVNKLGDRDRKIASRASYLLLNLQNSHPGMKPVILRTVELDILLHPSQDHRVKYYAINTLNQTILSTKEPTVAEALMRMYFDLFVTLLKSGSLGIGPQKEKEEPAEGEDEPEKKLGKPPGKPPPQRGAPKPTEQEVEGADKLVSAILTGVNRAAPFVGGNDSIMENHLDTLFRIAHSANFNTGIQALLLIQQVSESRKIGSDRFYRTLYESLLDPRLVASSKQALYLNLLLRAMKNDIDVRRVKAFAKRMLQITGLHQPPFVCGLLYVIAHIRGTFPDLTTLIQEPEESIFDDGEAEGRPMYDGRKRDPEHSNAQRSCLWEMFPVQAHYHPSVTVFAEHIMNGESKVPKPDLDSHSLIRFLDKFVYRSPKTGESARGASIMQPLKATKDIGDIWLGTRAAGASGPSVNSAAFWKKKAEDVAAEDVFFHNYFQTVAKEAKPAKAKGEDAEEEHEDEIWKALVSAQPDIEDDGSDVGFDSLDEDEMASDDDDEPDMDLDDDDEASHDGISDLDGSDEGMDEDGDSDGLVQIEEDEDGFDIKEKKSEKDEKKEKRKSRKKAMKELPMFASVDDYAELLGQEEDEDY